MAHSESRARCCPINGSQEGEAELGLQFLWPRPIGEGRTGMGWEWESWGEGGKTVTPFQKVLTSLSLCVPSRSGRKVLP